MLEAALTHSRFTEVVEATGLAKATKHRILGTLVDRRFRLRGPGQAATCPARRSSPWPGARWGWIDISAIARPFVDDLVERVLCTVHLGVVNGDEIVYLIRADSDKPYLMPSRVGLAVPMHSTGIGKVTRWATAPTTSWNASWPGPVCRAPDRAYVTSLAGQHAEIASVRRLGYAVDREENVPGLACVAAPSGITPAR